MRAMKVEMFSGPNLIDAMNWGPPRANKLRHEYGDLAFTVEMVGSMGEAVEYIHK